MKKYLVILLIINIIFLGGVFNLCLRKDGERIENNLGKEIPSENFQENKNKGKQDTLNNLLKHISFAEEALSKFDITSAEAALTLWLEGIKSGNGVLQYATMDLNLKQEFKEYLQERENLSWDTRVEEFSLDKYEIIEITEVSEKIIIYTVKLNYVNLQGEAREKTYKVTVVEEQGKWSISLIR